MDTWKSLMLYGASLSVGAQGQPPISTTQPYSNLTFGNGPKALPVGLAANPLVEDLLPNTTE